MDIYNLIMWDFCMPKDWNLFYSVKLGSVEVPYGRLELFKQGKTTLGKHLDQVIHEKKQHSKTFEIWTIIVAPYASEHVHFLVS